MRGNVPGEPMTNVVVVGGVPGSGKTSLARLLASEDPQGVHLEMDGFFRALAHRCDPSLPEADTQNRTVVRACLAATTEYAAGGYTVYLDGVIGPWLLPAITAAVPTFQYVLLHAPLATALARARERATQPSATPEVVTRMHAQFEAVLDTYRRHVIETEGRTVREVADEVLVRRVSGAHDLPGKG